MVADLVLHLPDPRTYRLLSGETAYQAAIDNGYFSLIALSFTDTTAHRPQIVADMRQAGTYHLATRFPSGTAPATARS